MSKYNFYTLRKTPRNEKLPEDVNASVEATAHKLGGDELVDALKKMRDKRLYGDILFINPTTKNVEGVFTFQDGMCSRFKLAEYPSASIIMQRSIHNSNLTIKKVQDEVIEGD